MLKANNECLMNQLQTNKKLREDEERKLKESGTVVDSQSPRKDSRLIPGRRLFLTLLFKQTVKVQQSKIMS